MDQKRSAIPTPDEPRGVLLATRHLTKSFGGFSVLNGLNLSVREGNIYGFLGRNGAGKTTTIQMLMGIQKPDGGNIELFGETVNRPTIAQKRRIGYVSQEQFFYPWMACRFLGRFVSRFYPTWDQSFFEKLLKLFDLPPERKVANLSQGMRVKLALALALAHRPAVLILDEPTSGLDPAARREFLELVSQQAQRDHRTTFFSSHIVEEVERIANRIGILEAGRLIYEGDLTTLQEQVRRIRLPDEEVARGPVREAIEAMGLQVLGEHGHDLVLRGDAVTWSNLGGAFPSNSLTLEDTFLAMTVHRVSQP